VNAVTRTRRLLVLAWLGAVLIGLTACNDDHPTGHASPSTSTSSSTGPATGSAEPTQSGTPTSTVAPATGLELREQTSSIHVPEGWIAVDPLVSYQSAARGPRGAGTIDLIDDETLNPGAPLADRVRSAVKSLPDGATYTRLPDVMLGDSVAYHLTYTMPGRTEVTDIVETERDQRLITINFTLTAKALEKDPDLVASVLASFQWVGP
jgi:hypothetical protein